MPCGKERVSSCLARISHHGVGGAELNWRRIDASLLAIGAKVRSAEACCRFPPGELARGEFPQVAPYRASKLAEDKAAASLRTPNLRTLKQIVARIPA